MRTKAVEVCGTLQEVRHLEQLLHLQCTQPLDVERIKVVGSDSTCCLRVSARVGGYLFPEVVQKIKVATQDYPIYK